MLSASGIVQRINVNISNSGRLVVVPKPDLEMLEEQGAASIDLRLGRWFRTFKTSRTPLLDVSVDTSNEGESELSAELASTREHFVRFGEKFIVHPRSFVLGISLEWLRLPADLGGYVTGKSSLGRRGLVIETAAGIQPGFSGCLALELNNVGEVPIALLPGMKICQVFFHQVQPGLTQAKSQFKGRRKPVLGHVKGDSILESLRRKYK